jgi:GNAT superfamily N-acetyltransferase
VNKSEVTPSLVPLRIRAAAVTDAPIITEFNILLARQTEARELDPNRVAAGVQALLADPAKGTYYVAEYEGRVVGQLLVTLEWSDWRNGWFWWIQSLYVAEAQRGRGVFRTLFHHLRQLAGKRSDICGLRLYVEHENQRARSTYERLGMERTSYHIYEMEFRTR